MRTLVMLSLAVLLSGCCTQVKNAIDAYATVVVENTQAGQALLTHCQNGDQPSCTGVGGILTGIEKSAKVLQQH